MAFRKKLFFVLCLGCVLLLNAGFVLALEVNYPDIPGLPPLNSSSGLAEYVCYLFGLITNLAILISVIVIAFGGVYYLISYGKGKFTDEGKSWVKAGILGLLIVVCASLIAYTINPDLTTCKTGILPQIVSQMTQTPTNPIPPGAKVVTYDEVPLGILMENALTKTIDCYAFDPEGNPIDGAEITGSSGNKINGPTYLDHDRVDCAGQLFDGAQKKAESANQLSKAIKTLMSTCSCAGKCDPPLLYNIAGACGAPPACFGPSSRCQPTAACTTPVGKVGPNGFLLNGDCCPDGTKQQIEHGVITIGGDPTETDLPPHQYNGLDEFRCPNPLHPETPCSGIVSYVEKTEKINNKNVKIIDKTAWDKLNLLQQLTYFKEKLDEIKQQEFQPDKNKLSQAKAKLATNNCYMASNYVDLIKTYETTNNQQVVILKNKTFTDSAGKKIDSSKYCAGFNYGNSSCLQKCNNACPDTSGPAVACYDSCNGKKGTEQDSCISGCYNSRPCTQNSAQNDSQTPKNFSSCISSCQGSCADNCLKKYSEMSDNYDLCKSQCENNSKCVLDNAGQCLFGGQNFVDCSSQATPDDQGNTNYCINKAYTCKSGSNEYAGYQDCAKPSNVKCSSYTDQSSCKNIIQCVWANGKCSQNYSSSFFYQNPDQQLCKNPYDSLSAKNSAACQSIYPQTVKCPASSNCPACSCDNIKTTLNFYVPTKTSLVLPSSCLADAANPHAGDSIDHLTPVDISAYRITGPECTGYSFNDDPLTYYCEQNWLQDPNREGLSATPLGAERTCSPSGEVPVGQTFDSVSVWLSGIISKIGKESQDIQTLANFLKQKVGDAWITDPVKNYCTCEAKYENNDPVCTTSCKLILDPFTLMQDCVAEACNGNSCQQMVDYVSKVSDYYRPVELNFIDIFTSGISDSYGRSDIIKQLTYSRQKTNECSLQSSAYGSQVRLLSCTRVEREIISPVNNGPIKINDQTINSCYGGWAGKIWGLTDNQFCCDAQIKNPTPTPGQTQ